MNTPTPPTHDSITSVASGLAEQLKHLSAQLEYPPTETCIMPNPDLRDRREPGYVAFRDGQLRPDIAKRKIQVPLLGYRVAGGIQITDGGTRLEAARLERLPTVPVLVLSAPPTPAEQRKACFLANEMRRDFSPAERNRFYLDEMRQTGLTRAAFCREYGLVESTVCRRLRWLEVVPADLHDKVGEGDGLVPERGAYALKDVEPEQRRETFEKMMRGLLTVEALENQNKTKKQKGRRKEAPVKARTSNGLAAVIPAIGLDQVIAEFSQVIEAVKKLQKHGLPLSALPNLLRRHAEELSPPDTT